MKTHVFMGKVSKATHARLEELLWQLQQLWNAALQERRDAFEKTKHLPKEDQPKINWASQFNALTVIREDDEFSRFALEAQRSILKRLDLAYQAFFRRVAAGQKPGHPRFKPKGRVRSFDVPCPKRIPKKGQYNVVSVKGVGKIKFKGELPEGKYKIMRIVKTPKRIKVMFVVEELPKEIAEDTREPIGIDLGIKSQATLSNGHQYPRNVVDDKEKKQRQRKASKADKGSNSYAKKRKSHQRECQTVAERERGKLHELTADIIKNHGAKIYVEDLQPEKMSRKGKHKRGLNREMRNAQWGKIVQLLTYKAENAGGWVRKVPPHGTTQLCSLCGGMPKETLTLDKRWYDCIHCGHQEDRDVNAAENVRQIGLALEKPGGNNPARGANVRIHTSGAEGAALTTRNGMLVL